LKIALRTGQLHVISPHSDLLAHLSGFGSRANRKRGFVFISKVLGKHYPARPAEMAAAAAQLAEQVRARLEPGWPTLVVGFAETATGLGWNVYEHLGLPDSFYIHTTRYHLPHPLWLEFREEHSHAAGHRLYHPLDPVLSDLRRHVRNVVLVDDEFSTGQTLRNLAAQLLPTLPRARRVVAVSLLNWARQPSEIETVSLIHGVFEFEPDTLAPENAAPYRSEPPQPVLLSNELPYNFGRFGLQKLAVGWASLLQAEDYRGREVLVLGTGELMHPAYQLACWLQQHGASAWVQSTTRSPLHVDGDIASRLHFIDHCHEDIDNFLYNLRCYDSILVCYEAAGLPLAHRLPDLLRDYADEVKLLFLRTEG
jgi:adenine/guanine phosphoribosyltransferase-like PRPP-binding protein